jgi:hypothetical protein
MKGGAHFTDATLRRAHSGLCRGRMINQRIAEMREAIGAGNDSAIDGIYSETIHELRFKFLEGKQLHMPLREAAKDPDLSIQQLKLFAA